MILLSCLSVLTLSYSNLLNSALAYGDFLKITNLLIIIIKKHLTGGNSTSKLLCVPQQEEGHSATFSNTLCRLLALARQCCKTLLGASLSDAGVATAAPGC